MTIAVGDRVPDVQLKMVDEHGTQVVSTGEVLGKGRVVVFGLPAAFSPTCSDVHLPGFVIRADDIRAHGVDRIFCVSVNDAYVMAAWRRSQGVGDKLAMLADGNGDLTRAMGVETDLSGGGLGVRSKRYAALIDDGTVSRLWLEDSTGLKVSSAETVLAALA